MKKIQRHSQSEMYAHVEACKNSKQTQKTYCKEQGMACSTFQYWAKKYREEHCVNEITDTASGFIPVKIQSDFHTNQEHTPSQLHFLMPNGVQVVCPETIQPQVLKALLNS